ncbi:unnamed protein product [Schistocephalus solidus]|uniref:RING-type domain-containing protein n=1 Tax=Schistocephalus solidus TaxID=70667 RepID=A0A183SUL0_SCHSO|nr:unnamed protein product [Schistocephalus solidus]
MPSMTQKFNLSSLSHFLCLFPACILQMYVRAPQAVQYKQRVASFRHLVSGHNSSADDDDNHQQTEKERPLPSAAEFASAGFFHTGRGDETVCGVCGLGLRDWQPADQADMSHARYALASALAVAEALRASGQRMERTSTSVPCLFLEVHRLLSSDLPLARKNLASANCSVTTAAAAVATQEYVNNLADRLAAIARMLVATGPPTWPVQNARRLGYSDDLILLGLWRLQSEATSTPISFVPRNAMSPNPQILVPFLRRWARLGGVYFAYMQGISEAIARQLNRFAISIAHKPASSLRAPLSRTKDPIPKEQQTNVIYRIPWANCSCTYICHTGRRLGTRITEHKLDHRRRDPLSLDFAHALEFEYRFNWDGTEIFAMAYTKQAHEFLEAWHSSTTSINRHVDLDSHYEGLRVRLTDDTAVLLRSILRIQESGLDDEEEADSNGDAPAVALSSRASLLPAAAAATAGDEAIVDGSPVSASEDAELAALPRQWRQRRPSVATVPLPIPRSKLPSLAPILTWWTEKWPQRQQPQVAAEEEPLSNSTLRPPASAVARKKANSTSM